MLALGWRAGVLVTCDIPTREFSAKVIACLPPVDWAITEENSRGRRDLRHVPVMSIDPPGCKDIDDALHARRLPNGNLEVGVHIADVTHFVTPGTPLDEEAKDRGTSTYLVEQRLDMLPGLLTTELCSLTSVRPHFAFSVVWEMTEGAYDVVNVEFFKSVILSKASLAYGEAQAMLDDPRLTGEVPDAVRALNSRTTKRGANGSGRRRRPTKRGW